MHRFRKKSDAKRGDLLAGGGIGTVSNPALPSNPFIVQEREQSPIGLPSLPPISDFRTSLILPDLARRFTLLRSTTGDLLTLDDLRARFAQQRATGAHNQISEEEEDMLLNMLSRIRSQHPGGHNVKDLNSATDISYARNDMLSTSYPTTEFPLTTGRQSTQSTTTMSSEAGYNSSLGSISPSSRASKRHSNNLFSGQFRDMRYMKKTSNRTIGSGRSVLSAASNDSTTGGTANALIDSYVDSLRPVTPDNSSISIGSLKSLSISETPTRSTAVAHTLPADNDVASLPLSPSSRFGKHLTYGQLHRMSVSLEDAIKEIEEEADDQVLVPRLSTSNRENSASAASEAAKAFAVSTDDDNVPKAISDAELDNEFPTAPSRPDLIRPSSAGGHRSPSPHRAGGSTSPVPRVPGYIPGMQRPVTPAREVELDDVRSHSTTPKAASPGWSYERTASSTSSIATTTGLPRRGSSASVTSDVRPLSPLNPLLSQKAQGDRSSHEDRTWNGSAISDYGQSSSTWKRPSSPLSNMAFAPLNGGSRPGTPSNVTWNVSSKVQVQNVRGLGRNGTLLGHARNYSMTSLGGNPENSDNSANESVKNIGRSRSPRPSSPVDDTIAAKILSNDPIAATVEHESSSGSSSLIGRSPTPSHELVRSPSATSVSEESSRKHYRALSPLHTPPTSPFGSKTQNNPLVIAAGASSRSSLVSVGSSYHSWEEGNGAGTSFLNSIDKSEPAWHEIPHEDTGSGHNRDGGSLFLNRDNPENILRHFTGLSKADISSIQGKLLEGTQLRSRNMEPRAPSTLRRRRPSTAQSIHSLSGQHSRTTSPAPPFSAPPCSVPAPYLKHTDNTAKANALLDAVVDSIPPLMHQVVDIVQVNESERTHVSAPSSPARRNKDLADILFGTDDKSSATPKPTQIIVAPHDQGVEVKDSIPKELNSTVHPATVGTEGIQETIHSTISSSVRKPVPDSMDLIRQVQERTDAAMAQLHRSPQQSRPAFYGAGVSRKRINLQDISSPFLVQSSTSIDKIPTVPTSPLNSQTGLPRTTKLSFSKRLRNTLRSKPSPPNGDEITPWTIDNGSAYASGSPRLVNRNLALSKSSLLSPGSTIDLTGNKMAISPPASAGPSLKNFMSRFRRKGQLDMTLENELRSSSPNTTSQQPSPSPSSSFRRPSTAPSSAPPLLYNGTFAKNPLPDVPISPSLSRQPTETPTLVALSPNTQASHATSLSDPNALKQFYDAAQNLGLDKSALNEFLARSQSRSKSPDWASTSLGRSDSFSADNFPNAPREIEPPDRSTSPAPEIYVEHPVDLARKSSERQYAGSPVQTRRVREIADDHTNAGNAVVRRTLIFPSANGPPTDFSSLVRKASKARKRTSNLSAQSIRSVHDRVPTPPPSRTKRLSIDPSPPVPILPTILSPINPGGLAIPRQFPEPTLDKSNSLHDSLYDMYSNDKSGGSQARQVVDTPKSPTDDSLPDADAGQALQLIEMANGETIWSIVNGLRADDAESIYQPRASFASEFSGGAHESDGEQLFFKEHTRNISKGSNSSNFVRGKAVAQTTNRPETKVFYSSSAHIARLIEQLSLSTDAGTFNIKPKQPTSHSHSSSFQSDLESHWTVEERLEHMLGAMNNT